MKYVLVVLLVTVSTLNAMNQQIASWREYLVPADEMRSQGNYMEALIHYQHVADAIIDYREHIKESLKLYPEYTRKALVKKLQQFSSVIERKCESVQLPLLTPDERRTFFARKILKRRIKYRHPN